MVFPGGDCWRVGRSEDFEEDAAALDEPLTIALPTADVDGVALAAEEALVVLGAMPSGGLLMGRDD